VSGSGFPPQMLTLDHDAADLGGAEDLVHLFRNLRLLPGLAAGLRGPLPRNSAQR
jgi:hypothetical protein